MSHDPLWLTTEAARLWGTDAFEESEEAVHEATYVHGWLDPIDETPEERDRRLLRLTAEADAEDQT